jgi:hypothetical protein
MALVKPWLDTGCSPKVLIAGSTAPVGLMKLNGCAPSVRYGFFCTNGPQPAENFASTVPLPVGKNENRLELVLQAFPD